MNRETLTTFSQKFPELARNGHQTHGGSIAGLRNASATKFIWEFIPFFVDHRPEMLYHITILPMTNNSVARPVFCVGIYHCFA